MDEKIVDSAAKVTKIQGLTKPVHCCLRMKVSASVSQNCEDTVS